jgi:hypothetical protein
MHLNRVLYLLRTVCEKRVSFTRLLYLMHNITTMEVHRK